MSWSCFF